jgi:ApbE superfamily uncharacterized protein (UPF0280 family)
VNKAMIERLTQLTLAAQGKPTRRPLEEILRSERAAADKYIPRQPVTKTSEVSSEQSP